MSNITTLPKTEIEKVSKQFSADAGYTYNGRLLHTVDDCVEQYKKADEVSKIAQSVIKDRMQGDALLKAKKLICGDEWNAIRLNDITVLKWKNFLKQLDLIQQNGQEKVNVRFLLDFAGYKEAEERLIEEGVEVETIDTASHYREVKKISETKTHEDIATTYTQAVGSNDGIKPKTAKEVKEVVQVSKKKVSSEELFLKEFPEYKGIDTGLSSMAYSLKLIEKIPTIKEDDWKSFYRLVSKCVHPDRGGSPVDMAFLVGLKELYSVIYKQQSIQDRKNEKMTQYTIWCEAKGCGIYDWIEDDSE